MYPYRLKFALCALMLMLAHPVAAESDSLPQAVDLERLGQSAEEKGIPILLMVSQYHCGFCELMKREVLQPMLISGDYADRVMIRELLIDPGETVTNFEGRREAGDSFSGRYRVYVTPTLLFLDGKGHEMAERILGINTIDYLLFYIEEAIDESAGKMARR